MIEGGNPDALGCGAAQGNVPGSGGQSEGLVVVAFEQAQFCSGTDAAGFEELEQAPVALIDTADRVGGSGGGIGEQQKAAMAAAGGAFHFAEVAVRTGAAFAQLGQESGFEVGRNGMLQSLDRKSVV